MSLNSKNASIEHDPNPPRCHLLALPREFRDRIYSYLSPNEEPDQAYMQLFLLPAVQVRFHNGPLLSLLHTHSRLRAEYLKAPWAMNVSITIRMGVEGGPFGSLGRIAKGVEGAPTLPVGLLCCHFLHHITILIDCGHACRSDRRPDNHHWVTLQPFVNVLVDPAPKLATIKIGMQYHARRRIYHFNHTDFQFVTKNCLPTPLARLGKLKLIQRGKGYRFDQDEIRAIGSFAPPSTRPPIVPPGAPNTRIVHGLVRNGAYLYVHDEAVWEKQCWTKDEVIASFPVRPYTRGWGIEKDAPWVARHEMREWREKRGIVLAKAWF